MSVQVVSKGFAHPRLWVRVEQRQVGHRVLLVADVETFGIRVTSG
jgi:hypothetical protein